MAIIKRIWWGGRPPGAELVTTVLHSKFSVLQSHVSNFITGNSDTHVLYSISSFPVFSLTLRQLNYFTHKMIEYKNKE